MTPRAYRGSDDFLAMQRLTQRCWGADAFHHIGDLAWQRFERVGREQDWPTMLWEEAGSLLAWAGIYERDPDLLYFQVEPRRAPLFHDVLDWFEKSAASRTLVVPVLDNQLEWIAALDSRGYAPGASAPFGLWMERSLDDLPAVEMAPGFVTRSMVGMPDPERRAAAHRAAWSRIAGRENDPPGQSRVTTESYRNVMAAWPYRSELDCTIEAPDGRWVANCIVWMDDENRVGEIEPLGVDADYRRKGLGRAVCLAALHALRRCGSDRALVHPRGDDAYPVPRRLYAALGFRTYATSVSYVRSM